MISQKPSNVHATRRDPATARVRVDVANTAFWEGKEFRLTWEERP